MKKLLTFILSIFLMHTVQANMILTGIVDGTLPGGNKSLEIYVYADIADLSLYGIGLANNGGGTDGQEYTFPADAVTAGTFIYLANDGALFTQYFGFDATYIDSEFGGFNGDDAIEIYENGTVIDIFGNVDEDGTGLPWDHVDSWVYRNNNTGPDGSTFVIASWLIQAPDLLDGVTTNAEAIPPFPFGTYIYEAPDNPVVSFVGSSITVGEADGTLDIMIGIVAANANETTIDVQVDASSTTDALDYTLPILTFAFPANSDASQTLTVTITDDANMETLESLVLTLSNPSNSATIGGNNTYTVSIVDNDTPIPALVITEINYNSPSTDSLEFIEIYNNDTAPIDLQGFSLSNALDHEFEVSTVLNPGEYFVICNDAAAWMNALGTSIPQWESGSLNNTGETIELYDTAGNLVDEVTYSDGGDFTSAADGQGPSLELCDVNSDNNDGNNWYAATTATILGDVFATPGAANTAVCVASVPLVYFIDDNPFETLLTAEDAGVLTFQIAIEDGNEFPTNVTVDLLSFTATPGTDFDFAPMTLTFPANVEMDTLTFTVEITDDVEMELIERITLGLLGNDNMSVLGDDVIVIDIADNDSPAAELVITEIYYNIPSSDTLEFIEIYNNGATEIDLSGARFLKGVFHVFADGTSIEAGDYIVICGNTIAFQNAFGMSPIQWDAGGLNNSGEDIVLYDASGNVADSLTYDTGNTFPAAANGTGPSLELCDPNEDNSDPFYWFASTTATGIMIDTVEILATPGMANGVICFFEENPVITFSAISSSVDESVGSAFVSVEITNGNTNATEVTITVDATSTATDGTDFTIASTTVTFPAGTMSDTESFEISITDDSDTENDETIVLTMSATNDAQMGAITTHTVTIEDNDGISNNNIFEGRVSIFPNPVNQELFINTEISFDQIRLMNVIGQEVLGKYNTAGNTSVNVSGLAKGVYFLQLTSGKETGSYQIVVQ
ncbi:MAG: hypothetical protein ACI94Y_002101 [Maribacter sp.]|jgi:hypothetical protein